MKTKNTTNKTLSIYVKCNEEELDIIRRKMADRHFTNISEFIRVTLLSLPDIKEPK